MNANDLHDDGHSEISRSGGDGTRIREGTRGTPPGDIADGSPEHLQRVFDLTTALADREVGIWLDRASAVDAPNRGNAPNPGGELRSLRTLVRVAAMAYARRLRDEAETPERMLVLVKSAIGRRATPGYYAQELTNDIVRWSIEAYFDE